MRLNTTALIGFSVIEAFDVESHARISEVQPPTVKVAEMLTRNGEAPTPTPTPPPDARLVVSMFARDGEAPVDDV